MKLTDPLICPKRKRLANFLAENPNLAEYKGQDKKIKASRNFDQIFNTDSNAGSDANNYSSFANGNNGVLSSNASNSSLHGDDEAARNPRNKRQRKISSAFKDPSFETDDIPMSLQTVNSNFVGNGSSSYGRSDSVTTISDDKPKEGEKGEGRVKRSSSTSAAIETDLKKEDSEALLLTEAVRQT